MPVPLVPVKALAEAKGRLHPWLSPLERRLLAIAMFEDVVAALQATPGLQAPLVVSPDPEMWRRAEAIGCRVVEEPAAGEGLNAALAVAAEGVGDGGLLVVAADLPLATAAGLGRVLEAAALAPVVVVPSHDGDGTNVLAWREPSSFQPRFGPGSAARHLAVPGAVRVDDPDLAMDVDTVEDLRLVAGRVDPAAVTGRRLRDLRLPARLPETG
jgi:2-phospho-L-lactate/phosphoenolpyruvate guanylyltransferase